MKLVRYGHMTRDVITLLEIAKLDQEWQNQIKRKNSNSKSLFQLP